MKMLVTANVPVAVVRQRIDGIIAGTHHPSSNTCWNLLGHYLRLHPGTKGTILFFGETHPREYVNHVVLLDTSGHLLFDSLKGIGILSADHRTYKRDAHTDALSLMTTQAV